MGLPGRRPGEADGQQVGIGAEDDPRHAPNIRAGTDLWPGRAGIPMLPGRDGRHRHRHRLGRALSRRTPGARVPGALRRLHAVRHRLGASPRSPSWSSSTRAPARRCSRRSRSRSDSCPISSRASCSRPSSTASRCVGCSSSAITTCALLVAAMAVPGSAGGGPARAARSPTGTVASTWRVVGAARSCP